MTIFPPLRSRALSSSLASLLALSVPGCGGGADDAQKAAAPQTSAAAPATASGVPIEFTINPNPPRAGRNALAVVVRQPDGAPVTDATVKTVFSMPAMPSMNMPAMRSEAALGHAGAGVYRGSLDVMMNGRWEASVTVTRGGQRLGSKQMTLMAR